MTEATVKSSAAERRHPLLQRHRTEPGSYDELLGVDGRVRPRYEGLLRGFEELGPEELKRRAGARPAQCRPARADRMRDPAAAA